MKCKLRFGSKCSGKVKRVNIFDRGAFALGLDIHACEAHIKEHEVIMDLYRAGHDIDDLLNMSAERRQELTEEQNVNDY
jgi:hypothetical protein